MVTVLCDVSCLGGVELIVWCGVNRCGMKLLPGVIFLCCGVVLVSVDREVSIVVVSC